MKTIAVTIPFGMSARNLLRSDFFKTMKDKSRVVIFSPFSTDAAFRQEFGGEHVFFEPLEFKSGLLEKVVRRIVDPVETWAFTKRTQIKTLLIYRDWLRAQRPLRYLRIRLLALLFGNRCFVGPLRLLYRRLLRHDAYAQVFSRYNVDLLFVTHLFNLADQQVAVSARDAGVPIIGMPHSWDNLTSKSGIRQGTNPDPGRTIPVRFDRMIVWNGIQRQELKDYYGYKDDEIFTSGIPQFDAYARREKILTRSEFLKQAGGDPQKKTILYAAGTPQYMRHQDEVVDVLIEIVRSGRLPEPVQLVVRHHPNRMAIESLKSLEAKYKNDPSIIFSHPPLLYTALSDRVWTAGRGDEYDLAHTLAASDVVITMASTITLDASAFDRPIINIVFDGRKEEPYFDSLKKTMEFTHYAKITETGAFVSVHNAGELEAALSRYLSNPGFESRERATLLKRVTGAVDGLAGKRIGEFLLDFVR